MIGVVVPAHDEQAYLDDCLHALRAAASDPALGGEAVNIVLVLDACRDGSLAIVERHAAQARAALAQCRRQDAGGAIAPVRIASLAVEARNVGFARAIGAAMLLGQGARWLAFTDADTRVGAAWLSAQLTLDCDAVCGSVAVDDWSVHRHQAGALREHFSRTYTDADGHRHIHGANLGVSAQAYTRAGGFLPLACSEDVALVEALQRSGARIAWSAAPRVATSARRDARARGGFGDTLLAVAAAMGAEASAILLQPEGP